MLALETCTDDDDEATAEDGVDESGAEDDVDSAVQPAKAVNSVAISTLTNADVHSGGIRWGVVFLNIINVSVNGFKRWRFGVFAGPVFWSGQLALATGSFGGNNHVIYPAF